MDTPDAGVSGMEVADGSPPADIDITVWTATDSGICDGSSVRKVDGD